MTDITQYGLGCTPTLPDLRDYQFATLGAPADIRQEVDYRADLPPSYNQGPEGSCTAFAAGAAYRYARRKLHNWPRPAVWSSSIHYDGHEDYDISFQTQYYLSRELEGTIASDAGATIGDSVRVLHQFGACAHHNYEYIPGNYAAPPPSKAIANAANHTTTAYYRLDGSDNMYKQALSAGYLPLVGIVVYNSFYNVGFDGIVPMPQPGEVVAGGHALCVVGYRSSDGAYLVRNSWGTYWGLDGYCWFPKAYLTTPQLCFETWCISIGAT